MIFNAQHAISISCCLKVVLLTLFCITKPRKTLEEDLIHVQKTGTAQLSYSLAINSYVFKIPRPLRDVKFTINLAHGDKLIGRFYYILHGFSNKNLCPPPPFLNQYYPNPFLIKERRKSENLSLKSFFWTSEQPWRSQKSVRKHKDLITDSSFNTPALPPPPLSLFLNVDRPLGTNLFLSSAFRCH